MSMPNITPKITPKITHITSRDNTWLKELRKLNQDSSAYRKQGQVWLEAASFACQR